MSHTHFANVQQLGRALMLPIAVLPVAGLLLRLGQPDLLDVKLIARQGDAIFSNLALLFAVGVAVGFARENTGVAGLAGVVGYLVMIAVAKTIDDKVNPGVLAGIISGVTAGALYNRYWNISLPEYLAFFGGKRFVPIVTGVACLVLGIAIGLVWPPLQKGIDGVGHWLLGAGVLGVFVYGVLNRLLLVTGLHHILNSLVWFVFGTYEAGGKVVTGDLHRFFAGDPTAGTFMSGFFPIMMFGLPGGVPGDVSHGGARAAQAPSAVCFCRWPHLVLHRRHRADRVRLHVPRAGALRLHALLTGVSMALMRALDVRLGFTFSAGAFDYLLSYGLGQKAWLLLPVGLAYFVVYYGVFTFCIRHFQLATPGREAAAEAPLAVPASVRTSGRRSCRRSAARELAEVDACTTRLRLAVVNGDAVDTAGLKALGSKGIVRPSPGALQVVLGPEADIVADAIRAQLGQLLEPTPAASAPRKVAAAPSAVDRAAWVGAIGGEQNLRGVEAGRG